MSAIKVSIVNTGSGLCALSQKEGDGLSVVFEGERETFLSWKAFRQIVAMKAAQVTKPHPTDTVTPRGHTQTQSNGPVQAVPVVETMGIGPPSNETVRRPETYAGTPKK